MKLLFFSLFHYLVSFYLLAAIFRFYLPLIRADYNNPLSQFIVRITHPVLLPLRRLIPSRQGLDIAGIVLILAVQAVEVIVILLVVNGGFSLALPFFALFLGSLVRIGVLFFTAVFYSLIICAILSWINPQQLGHPAFRLLASLPAPFINPIRKWVPPLGGIDFSPMILGFALIFLNRLVLTLAIQVLPSIDTGWFMLMIRPLEFIR